VLGTSTSPPAARAPTRAAMWTAIPPTSPLISSTSPECSPMRTSRPEERAASAIACPHRIARARTVEGREEAVAQGLHLASAETHQLASHRCLMRGEQFAPARIPELRRSLRRAGDVREHQRREHAVGLGDRTGAGQELLDFPEHGFRVTCPGEMVDPRKLDVPGVRDLRGELLAASIDDPVAAPVNDERRNVDRRGTRRRTREVPPRAKPRGSRAPRWCAPWRRRALGRWRDRGEWRRTGCSSARPPTPRKGLPAQTPRRP